MRPSYMEGFFISRKLELYFQFIQYSLHIGGQNPHIINIFPKTQIKIFQNFLVISLNLISFVL